MSMQSSQVLFDPVTHPRKATLEGFTQALLELGERNPDVVALSADLAGVTGVAAFAEQFPDRAFNVGIAEQNLVGIGAGLASSGLIPFVTSYAPFLTMRSIEQIRDDVAYTKMNVKLVAACGGISLGTGGSTHHSTEDLAFLRAIPNMTILVPADSIECYKSTFAAAEHVGPTYIRMGAGPRAPEFVLYGQFCPEDYDFQIGKAVQLRDGNDATIIATGSLVLHSILASDALKQEGIGVRVLNMHTIKPIDREAIIEAAQETKRIVTAEEHNIYGGLGGAVAEVLTTNYPVPMRMIGLNDIFASIGPTYQLQRKYGLTYEGVIETVRRFVKGSG